VAASIEPLRTAWTAATDYESKRLRGFVAVASVVLGFLVSRVLSLVWIEVFGFSRIMTTLTRYVAIFALFSS